MVPELVVFPVLAHFGVEEILVDRRQFLFQGGIQFGDDFLVSLHGEYYILDGAARPKRERLNHAAKGFGRAISPLCPLTRAVP
jgi:hypothetical protein